MKRPSLKIANASSFVSRTLPRSESPATSIRTRLAGIGARRGVPAVLGGSNGLDIAPPHPPWMGGSVGPLGPTTASRRRLAAEAAGMLPRALQVAHHSAQASDRGAQLTVAHVRRWTETQDVSTMVGLHSARGEPCLELVRPSAPQGEEPSDAREGRGAIARDH